MHFMTERETRKKATFEDLINKALELIHICYGKKKMLKCPDNIMILFVCCIEVEKVQVGEKETIQKSKKNWLHQMQNEQAKFHSAR